MNYMKLKYIALQIIIITFAVLLSNSCTNAPEFYHSDEQKYYSICQQSDTVQGVLIYNPDDLTQICNIEFVDSLLMIFTNRNDSMIMVYNTHSDSIVSHFGRYGNARNELLDYIGFCQFDKSVDNQLLMRIQDENRKKIITYNIASSIEKGELVYQNSFKYDIPRSNVDRYRCYYRGENDYLIHLGLSGDGDARDEFIYPPAIIGPINMNTQVSVYPHIVSGDKRFLRYAYNIMSQISPDHQKIAEAHGNIGVVTIYDIASGRTVEIKNEDSYDFEYIDALGRIEDDSKYDKLLICTTGFNVSEKYIAICQDGKLSMNEMDMINKYSPIVCIFDWNGKLISHFVTRESIVQVAINDGERCLYGVDCNGNVYRYKFEILANS